MLKRDIPPGIDLIKGRELAWLFMDFLGYLSILVFTAWECSYWGVVDFWCGKDGNFLIKDFLRVGGLDTWKIEKFVRIFYKILIMFFSIKKWPNRNFDIFRKIAKRIKIYEVSIIFRIPVILMQHKLCWWFWAIFRKLVGKNIKSVLGRFSIRKTE